MAEWRSNGTSARLIAMLPSKTGRRPSDATQEPIDWLMECHDRVRHFTTVALRVARSSNASARLIVDAASALRRYFGTALPAHERDEDDCVTPRLIEMRPGREIEHALARMAGDHRAISDTLAVLDRMWARVIVVPGDLAGLSDAMHAQARSLVSTFDSHLQLEEETIFPALNGLPEAGRRLLFRELQQRRPPSGTQKVAAATRDGAP